VEWKGELKMCEKWTNEKKMKKYKDKDVISSHLKQVLNEIQKLIIEIQEKPQEFGLIESRLFWAIRGADPHKAICTKHNQKIIKNYWGEYVCPDCIDEHICDNSKEINDNLWFDPDNEPSVQIDLKYTG